MPANGIPGDADILEASQDMYSGVGQHDTRPGAVLYRELGLAALAGKAADAARQVLAPQRLDVLDLKALDVQILHAQQCNRVTDLEA